jgi:hypothetical protein
MESGARTLCVAAIVLLIMGACGTTPPPQQQTDTVVQVVQPTPQPTPEVTPPPADKATEEFVASEELYKKTFSEVQAVIEALTKIIANADYDQWITYLTSDYIQVTGSAANLSQVSSAGVLKKDGIVLKTLKDYFQNVVVRSHLQASLDDIQFVDATHVKAITRIQGSSVILYYLVREDSRWKVGIQQAEQK